MFTRDVLGRRDGDEKQAIFYARLFVVAIVVVCYVLALLASTAKNVSVFNLGVWCFSGFAALFPVIAAALYWRGLTKCGTYASIITTALAWLLMLRAADWGNNHHYSFLGQDPIVTLFAASTIVLVTVSLMTKQPSESTLAKFFPEQRQN
jgi:solute:Na+ symporter, SSS family